MTATEVIAGAVSLGASGAPPAPLLLVPGLAALAIEDARDGARLVVHNPSDAPVAVTADGGDEDSVAPGASVATPLQATPDGDRLRLQLLSAAQQRLATVVVSLEPSSEEDVVAVGQAISSGRVVTGGLAGDLSLSGAGRVRVISGSKDLEPGARAMLLAAEGLFRFDVMIVGDALQTFVRNLTEGELELHGEVGQPRVAITTLGLAARYAPGRADLRFAVGRLDGRVVTEVTIATVRFPDRGIIRATAQAIVRCG